MSAARDRNHSSPRSWHLIRSDSSHPKIRWRVLEAADKAHLFAYLPAQRFNDRTNQPPVQVTFTLHDVRTISRQFAPDSAQRIEISRNK